MATMKAVVFQRKNQIAVQEVPKPVPRAGEAVIRITTTTICGTDVHIVRGEYPVKPGLVLGHEPVGVIDELGDGFFDHLIFIFKKFRSNVLPDSVRIDSGWNCTPSSAFIFRCRTPITSPRAVLALTTNSFLIEPGSARSE